MITYICHLEVPTENRAALAQVLTEVRDRSLAEEPGVLHYSFAQAVDDPERWVVVEVYRDRPSHAAHMAAPWVLDSIPQAKALVRGDFDIRRYVSLLDPGEN
jgi:quinol monooxygenase YgiN